MIKAWDEYETDERLPFGELAVLEEMVTRDQLHTLLAHQANRRSGGSRSVKIGTLLVREGYLSKRQGKRILRIQKDFGPIEGYSLLEHLGSGGMGSVFRTIREETGDELAIKILPPRATHDQRYRTRFMREAKLLAQLDHPNLVKCYDQGESNDHLYYAMELVPGRTGRAILKEEGAFSERQLRHSLRQALSAMEHYWEQRIVHRDIKPENIMFTPEFEMKLTDLGLSRQLDDGVHITRVGKTLGTPLYISPELAQGRSDIDIRSDLYSLGATFFHFACGVPPFMAMSQGELLKQHVEDPPPSPRLKNPRLSEGMETIILKLLEKDPADRFETPRDVMKAIDRVEQGKSPISRRARRRSSSSSREALPLGGRRRWSQNSGSGTRTGWQPKPPRKKRFELTPVFVLLGFGILFGLGVFLGSQAPGDALTSGSTNAAATDEFGALLQSDPEAAAKLVLDDRAGELPTRIERLRDVSARLAPNAPSRVRVDEALAQASRQLETEALVALEEVRNEVIELVDAARFDEARRLLASYPSTYRVGSASEAYDELDRELTLAARDAMQPQPQGPGPAEN